jgi:hypothetical protein
VSSIRRGPTAEQQLQAAKSLVRREVLRQVIAPLRVIATRMVLYYVPRTKGFTRPWVSVRNAVPSLSKAGAIVSEQIDGVPWYHLPRVKRDKLDEARDRKVPIYAAWTGCLGRGGAQAEELWRLAFRGAGWIVPLKATLIPCPNPKGASHAEDHEIDVFASLPGRYTVACEVKNGPAEGWIDPDVVQDLRLTGAQLNVRHHFEAMNSLGMTPMLAAPFVDPSFYPFQARHGGVHAKYLYHVFHPSDAAVAQAVKDVFRIGHIWASDEPPANFGAFIARLPNVIDKIRLAGRPWEEPPEDVSDVPEEPEYPDRLDEW